jgi:sugar O-acyltransferase (sialic acid O-acetyltransferase NeuD family)
MVTQPLIGIYGVGGFGREVMEIAKASCAATWGEGGFRLAFIDDASSKPVEAGTPVYSLDAFCSQPETKKYFNVAIADCGIRRDLVGRCEAAGLLPLSVRSPLSSISESALIGEGAILCQFTVVSVNVAIGRFFHLNHHSYVSHDCVIGDFVTFAPAVHCNGTIKIDDCAYVGSGAVVRQSTDQRRVVIGSGAMIGMGAVVLDSVAPGATVVGNPARVLGRGLHSRQK